MPLIWAERYQIIETLAEHHSVQILSGRDLLTQEPVILKCLHLQQLRDWEQWLLFERESRYLQSMTHPRLPRWLDWLELPGPVLCLVQSRLPGENLQKCLQAQGPYSETEVIPILAQALHVLQALHGRVPALFHLDLKPSNFLLAGHSLYLIDFGSATEAGSGSTLISGTPGYSSPEQLAGQPGAQSDLYSLGATCIELLSGHAPSTLRVDNQLKFWEALNCSVALKNWLEIMVHPDSEMRYDSAAQALHFLPGAAKLSVQLLPPARLEAARPLQAAQKTLLQNIQSPPELAGYTFIRCLKSRGGTQTWLAEKSTAHVIVKYLHIPQIDSIKEVLAFEREIHALQNLAHPRLPQVLQIEKRTSEWFWVQNFLAGETLQARLESGWQATEAEIWDCAEQALAILQILHTQSPPLLHRDLCPENLLWYQEQLYFLDFGGSQQRWMTQGTGGSTLIGSLGFSAPEQYIGQAVPASDLFGLGMSLVSLLTGRLPIDCRWQNQQLQLPDLPISRGLQQWLLRMTHQDLGQRYTHVAQAQVTLVQQRERFFEQQRQAKLASPAGRQARQERLRQAELAYSDYRENPITAHYRNHCLNSELLYHAGLRFPPSLRIELADQGHSWKLFIPASHFSKHPRLHLSLSLQAGLLKFWPMFLIFAFFGLFQSVFSIFWIVSLGLPLWRWHTRSELKCFFQNLHIELTAEHIDYTSEPPTSSENLGSYVKHLNLRYADLNQLTLEVLPTPKLCEGSFYQVCFWQHNGQVLRSAPCYLLDAEQQWLTEQLPVVLAAAQQGLLTERTNNAN